MDCSSSTPSPPLDESDEPQTPLRSPSRLDFCMEDLEDGGSVLEAGDDSAMQGTDWDDCPYTFIAEGASAVNIALLGRPRPLIVRGGEDDPPQATDSHSHENADTPHIPREHPIEQIVIKPQSPKPVRPPGVQFQHGAEEHTPPSPTAPQRLNYPHHGLSRSALLQQKTLWSSRHEEWAEWQSRMEQGDAQKQGCEPNDAYTGLAIAQARVGESPPPYMRIPPSGLERDLADNPPRQHEQEVHASIFPRVGDISALRDPYSVNIDRCFFKYPLWTLHKTLYVFNMHQRSASLAPSASVYNTAHAQASMSSSTLSSYTSSASGDDEESDSTLVADDSPIPKGKLPLDPLECVSSPHSPPSWNRLRAWELSWYARWELLIGLFQRDYAKRGTPDMLAPEPKEPPSSPPARIFRFAVGEDEENDDDDDEDYGTIVSDSTFSVDFEEECERALAFYSRESKCSEVTW